MTTHVCADCGSTLERDGFIQAVCGECGGLDAVTLGEYHTQPKGSAEAAFWRKNGTAFFALTDASISNEAWIAAESPGELTR